jgi:protein-disulfide isomerase
MTFTNVPYDNLNEKKVNISLYSKVIGGLLVLVLIVFGINYAVTVFAPKSSVDGNKWIPSYSLVLGKKDSKIKMVYFFDLQCPACKDNDPKLTDLVTKYQDRMGFVYRNYPLTSIHPFADLAAKGAQGALRQGQDKYLEFKKQIFAVQNELSASKIETAGKNANLDIDKWNNDRYSSVINDEVKADLAFVTKVNLPNSTNPKATGNNANGTPTVVLIEDEKPIDWWSGSVEQTTQEATINKYLDK